MGRFAVLSLLFVSQLAVAQPPEDFEGFVAASDWTNLHMPGRRTRNPLPIPEQSKLKTLDDVQLIGPGPGHPHLLGQFSSEGQWGLVNGYLQPISGKNAVLQIAWANEFELTGTMEQIDYGGWFLIVGWDQGRGYVINHLSLKKSGSPWFVGQLRGFKTIEERTVELPKLDWIREQDFELTVKDQKLSLSVGRFKPIDELPIEDYAPGRILLGVYEGEYGPKPLRIKSLKIRSLDSESDGTQ